MTRPTNDSAESSALAGRLRQLRETGFRGRSVTQRQLAAALGGDKPLSVSSISAYENPSAQAPPDARLQDYATFFATERSVSAGRLLTEDELTADERAARDGLLAELLAMADRAPGRTAPATEPVRTPSAPILLRPAQDSRRPIWRFPEGESVRIVCGELARMDYPYSRPGDRNYTQLLSYADLDALVELFGHVRMMNPTCDIRFMLHGEFNRPDDLNSHVVILGGSGLNPAVQRMVNMTDLPIMQDTESEKVRDGDAFEVSDRADPFLPGIDDSLGVVEDVGLFARLTNPYNISRTLTVCSGIFAAGVLGAVRTLTDATRRDSNERYLRTRFQDAEQFAVLVQVPVSQGKALTPDLRNRSRRLYEWSDDEPVDSSGTDR